MPGGRRCAAGTTCRPRSSALMRGRTRVELTRDEAGEALEWAGGLDGWADAEPKPLHVYPGS